MALNKESEFRDDADCRVIAPYVRSLSFLKAYSGYEYSDFISLMKDIKLHKKKRGSRICNYGEMADSIYVIVSGRIAITHPDKVLMGLHGTSMPHMVKERTEIMTEKQLGKEKKRMNTVTAKGAGMGVMDTELDKE